MKRSLIMFLVLIFMVSVIGSAFAASPSSFSDVPNDHWAYAAVKKIVNAGLVEGYSDQSFQGDRPISRYEFAVITSRALEKNDKADKANQEIIHKLSNEFATELNMLKVRVDKVEAKTKTWVSGETRFRYMGDSPKPAGGIKLRGSDNFDFRQRIVIKSDIDDKLSFTGRLSASGKIGNGENGNSGSTTNMDLLNITANKTWGLDSIRIGRMGYDMLGNGLIGKPASADGIAVYHHFGEVQFKAWTGNVKSDTALGTGAGDSGKANQLTSGELSYKVSDRLRVMGGYYWSDIPGTAKGNGEGTVNVLGASTATQVFSGSRGWLLGFDGKVGDYTLLADYVSTNLQEAVGLPANPKAWAVQFGKMTGKKKAFYNASNLVDVEKAGTSGWAICYHVSDPGAIPTNMGGFDTVTVAYAAQPYSTFTHATDNTKAWMFAYQYTLKKNVLLSLDYADFKIKNRGLTNLSSDQLDKCYSARIQFFY